VSVLEEYSSVSMTRENLEDIPQFPVPPGFSIRWFQEGDEVTWHEIQSMSERYLEVAPDLFWKEFGSETSILGERLFFLYDSRQRPIGTATAWFDKSYRGIPHGRVGWLAIVPEMRGKGLSKPLMTILCNRLRKLGHQKTYLTTSTVRFPAIRLYSIFGFVPEIRDAQDQEIWDKLEQLLRNGHRV
jgi:GNAT superfamily N-acetyltransferase